MKKIQSFLLVVLSAIFLFGCAGGKINYNVKEPAGKAAPKEKTVMLYGVYREQLNFRVIAVNEKDGARIVIMNDIGVKLQDMKITKDNGTDIYFIVNFFPKNTIEEFERIFRKYFIDENKEGMKPISNRIYFYENGEEVLWFSKM